MHILGGTLKGTILKSLDGINTRPTIGRVVENIFNIIKHNKYIDNFKFDNQTILDLFAGSGRLGLEGLSRGAQSCCFIDNHHQARKIIQENVDKCHMQKQSSILNYDLSKNNIYSFQHKFSLIFCDAPYYKNLPHIIIDNFIAQNCFTEDALLCIETEKNFEFPYIRHLIPLEIRDYGNIRLHFLRHQTL